MEDFDQKIGKQGDWTLPQLEARVRAIDLQIVNKSETMTAEQFSALTLEKQKKSIQIAKLKGEKVQPYGIGDNVKIDLLGQNHTNLFE